MTTELDLNWPLMRNNITRADLDAVCELLRSDDPILTQASQVRAFEKEWSEWVGVKQSVFVNSGSSANLVAMQLVRDLHGPGEVIVPPLTWVSDIASVLQSGLTPVFADINLRTLGMDTGEVLRKITPRTKAVFITHILGYNALTESLLSELKARQIPLIEDVCESHGATFQGKRLGSYGWISNFSSYYAHHLSTIEGGFVCVQDPDLYQRARMYRAHGLVRESDDQEYRQKYYQAYPDLNPDFVFAFPAYNIRSTEINATIGRSQLKRLDANNQLRRANFELFLRNLDSDRYFTDFDTTGSCNYAFTLILRRPDPALGERVFQALRRSRVEFRRGTSGGGNQLRQPYLRKLFGEAFKDYPVTDHVHFYGVYLGNYPGLEQEKILALCKLLNGL